MFNASQSKINLWRRCRQAAHHKYIDKLRKKKKKRPFKFGGLLHNMLEIEAMGDDPFAWLEDHAVQNVKLFKEEKEIYGEIIQDLEYIMDAYLDYWPEGEIEVVPISGQYAEHKFNVEVAPGLMMNGIIDEIAKTRNDLHWITDHKSFGKRANDDDRWRNVQSAIYFRATQLLEWGEILPSLDGFLWNYVYSKAPTRPQILKNGTMSTKNIVTFPEVIRDVIRENGLRAKDYRAMIKQSKTSYPTYFQRVFMPVGKSVVDMVTQDFINTAYEMQKLLGKDQTKSISFNCGFCDFEPLCRASLQNQDIDFIKEKQYEVSKKPTETKQIHTFTIEKGPHTVKPQKIKKEKKKGSKRKKT